MTYTDSDLILSLENRIPAYYVSLNFQPKFYTLAGMFLESAATHASRHGFGYHDMIRDEVYWVLSRFHVIMHKYPGMDEKVKIETWPKGPDKLFFVRDYRMLSEDDTLLADATTAWLVLDGKTGRPKKINDSNLQDFHVDNLHAIEALPGKLPAVSEPDRVRSLKALYSDLDLNQHVNAVKYIEWVQDCYDEELYKSKNVAEFQINYQLETRYGQEVTIRMRNLSEDDPYEYFEGIRSADRKTAFRARIKFGDFK
jgi:acyl-ACP thioesterase